MGGNKNNQDDPTAIDIGRRRLIRAAGAAALATTVSGVLADDTIGSNNSPTLRWGIVSTGMIANNMARMIDRTPVASLAAVSSRRMESAKAFASTHGIPTAFDSWQEMISSPEVDAIYVATPTFIREEICVAAANSGKHVLGEKPFANLKSLQHITSACRKNGVAFMDGTHFVHHPRTAHIRSTIQDQIGKPSSIVSTFQFGLTNADNIRFNPELEPYGAIGDAGWYNMRAAVEYASPGVELIGADAFARRDQTNGAVVSAGGVLGFSDGSTSTWNCGFDAGAVNMDLQISAAKGQISLNDFVSVQGGEPANYELRTGGIGNDAKTHRIEAGAQSSAAILMFEDFSAMVGNQARIADSIAASEKTQAWLDAAWEAALGNEKS